MVVGRDVQTQTEPSKVLAQYVMFTPSHAAFFMVICPGSGQVKLRFTLL